VPPAKEKKKIRKINPFASAQPRGAQAWPGGDGLSGDGLIPIPTELSPVKGPVPQRAVNLRASAVLGRR